MFSLPFLQRRSNPNKFLAIQITAESIKAVAFYVQEAGIKMIGFSEEPLIEGAVRAGHLIDIDSVATSLKICVERTNQDLEEKVTNAIIGIEGDNCLGITTTGRVHFGKPTLINPKSLGILYKEITEAAYIQAQNTYIQTVANQDADLEIVTSSNVYSKIDGKDVPNPVGSSGSVLECAIFNAFTPSYHIKAVQKAADKADVHILTFGPVSYAITQSLKAVPQEPSDFVILNIGVDFTEAAVIFGGGVVATKTLNLGYQHFIEGINNKMGLTSRESTKVLESYCSGQLSESESVVVHKCIQDTLEIWTNGINLLFEEFVDVKTFAPQIYITGKSAGIPDLITLMREKPWYKSIPFKALPQVKKLNLSDLVRITDATGKITASSWVPVVALGNIYLELYGNA